MDPRQAQLVMMVLLFVIFYFLLIRPQMRAQKKAQEEHKKLIAALKKNDEVTTSGGIYGTVVNVKEASVTLRVDDNVKIEVLRSAITTMRRKASE